MDTHHLVVDFGKYRGQPWTRVPVSYLKWLQNQRDCQCLEIVNSELQRRGVTELDEVEITTHAINNASLRLMEQFKLREHKEQGIYTWLYGRAVKALSKIRKDDYFLLPECRITSDDIAFVFKFGQICPVLKTVLEVNKNKKHKHIEFTNHKHDGGFFDEQLTVDE